ncbi:MAG: DNA/RNA non-specific endonuclease [bacterium]
MKNLILFMLCLIRLNVFAQQFNYMPSSSGEIVNHSYYSLAYNEDYEQATWVAYQLTDKMILGNLERTDNFREDTKISTKSATLQDYYQSGYDRGHLAPAADMKHNYVAMSESFLLSNISPQLASFNRGKWRRLENQVRKWVMVEKELYVVTGGLVFGNTTFIGKNNVAVATHFYKVILDYSEPEIKAIAILLPHKKIENSLENYIITIDSLEEITNIDFFPAIPDEIENNLESKLFKWEWDDTNQKQTNTVQCKGIAKSTNNRCKLITMNVNGYCHHHQVQVNNSIKPSKTSARCSAITKSTGNRCKRVADGKYCWQHK